MISRSKTPQRFILLTILLCGAAFLALAVKVYLDSSIVPSTQELQAKTFRELLKIRQEKKSEIQKHLEGLEQKAFAIENDAVMRDFFDLVIQDRISSDTEYAIDLRYIEKYGDFYDILFVDKEGVVRHSIKKESDYTKNLFSPPFRDTILSRTLKQSFSEKFSEFEFYHPSGEPAAFFTIPMKKPSGNIGWFVLQLAANSLNGVLTDRRGMGKTGEVYLVNEKKLMLTDSRFLQQSTILKKKVATEAVEYGFLHGEGERIIDDYRGLPVFSSFEKLDIFGSSWMLIAEIDEAEILTDFYRNYENSLLSRMLKLFHPKDKTEVKLTDDLFHNFDIRVDMNEFEKQQKNQKLVTFGVATCTAVAVIHPGKFGYLAHLSPTDEIYMQSRLTRLGIGEKYSNLLQEMFAQISFYDVLPYEQNKLQVVVIVSHKESIAKVVEAILDQEGLNLHNIRLMYNSEALSANVLLSPDSTKAFVEWHEPGNTWRETSATSKSMMSQLKTVTDYSR